MYAVIAIKGHHMALNNGQNLYSKVSYKTSRQFKGENLSLVYNKTIYKKQYSYTTIQLLDPK